MKQKSTPAALAIVEALRSHPDTAGLPYNVLLGYANDCLEDAEIAAIDYTVLNSPVPEFPNDNKPAKKYPRRETLKPTPDPQPDPEKTEHGPTKYVMETMLPYYDDDWKPFLQAIGETVKAAEGLFEAQSDTTLPSEKIEEKRRNVLASLDEVRQTVYTL